MEEMADLMGSNFGNNHVNLVKDIFVFQSFTGLSYAELRELGPDDLITGVDGKLWISKNRQKTGGNETLSLLATALDILENTRIIPSRFAAENASPSPVMSTITGH